MKTKIVNYLEKVKAEDIRNLVLAIIGLYLSYIFIVKELDKEAFEGIGSISYYFIPFFSATLLVIKSPIKELAYVFMAILLILVFLMCICFFKPSINKKMIMKIWKLVLLPLLSPLALFIRGEKTIKFRTKDKRLR